MIVEILICSLAKQIMAPPLSTTGKLARTKKKQNKTKYQTESRVHVFQTWKKQLFESDWLRLIDLKKYITKNNHIINNINENSNNKKPGVSIYGVLFGCFSNMIW